MTCPLPADMGENCGMVLMVGHYIPLEARKNTKWHFAVSSDSSKPVQTLVSIERHMVKFCYDLRAGEEKWAVFLGTPGSLVPFTNIMSIDELTPNIEANIFWNRIQIYV